MNLSVKYQPMIDDIKIYNLKFPSRVMYEMTENPSPKNSILKAVITGVICFALILAFGSFLSFFSVSSSVFIAEIKITIKSKNKRTRSDTNEKITPYNKAEIIAIRFSLGLGFTI